jgi:hypothetical protein
MEAIIIRLFQDPGSPCRIGFPPENSTGLASAVTVLGRDDALGPSRLRGEGTGECPPEIREQLFLRTGRVG